VALLLAVTSTRALLYAEGEFHMEPTNNIWSKQKAILMISSTTNGSHVQLDWKILQCLKLTDVEGKILSR